MRLRSKISGAAVGVILLLLAIRAYLPIAVQRYVNRTLDRVPEYGGEIGDVDLALIRGAYTIDNMRIVKTSGNIAEPLFRAETVDLSIEWRALLEGKFVGEIQMQSPELNFVNAPTAKQSQLAVDAEWLQAVKDLFPLRINSFKARDGKIHYRDPHRSPKVNVTLMNVSLTGRNFSNTRSAAEGLVATISGSGVVEGDSTVEVNVKLAPAEDEPTFSLDGSLRNLQLVKLNDFLRAYANIDAEDGTLSIDTELAAKEGDFRGYLKPLIQDAELLSLEDDADGPIQLLWESLVSLFAEVFENQRHEQIGTRVEFSGSFDDPQSSIWQSLGSAAYNAFIRALRPGIEESVDLQQE